MEQDSLVHEYFSRTASFWKSVYSGSDVAAAIYQKRRDIVLKLIDDLRLPAGTSLLDIGCGAGTISIPLALRGFRVSAVDCVPEMIELTNRFAIESGISSNVKATMGDVHNLPFPAHTFDLVLAIGVLPWLQTYIPALEEVARVLRPGGHVIVSIDNRWGLHRICDPATNFLLEPLRRIIGGVLRQSGRWKSERGIRSTLVSAGQVESLLRRSGFVPERGFMLGFGPFSIFQRTLISPACGLRLGDRLQRLCDRGVPLLRSMGSQYIALAQSNIKPEIT